jgi:carboxymethylenebutenolidase
MCLSGLAGGMAVAHIFGCGKAFGLSQLVSVDPDDSRINTKMVKYRGLNDMKAYMARSSDLKKYPTIFLFHDIYGLDKHMKDVARRFALEGFFVLVPDTLAPMAGTPGKRSEAVAMMRRLMTDKDELKDEHDKIDVVKNFEAAIGRIQGDEFSDGRVFFVGFGWGGTMAVQLAARSIDIPAAVSFYGRMTKFRGRKNLRTEFLYHVPDNDNRFTKQLHDYETQLIDAKIQYTIHRYRDTNSGFFNDTTPKRYNEEEAELTWTRSIELLKDKLIDKRFYFR